MAISDLEEGSVEILKHTVSVTAFGPTVQHILPAVKYSVSITNTAFYSSRGEILGTCVEGTFHRLFAEKFWINTTDFVGHYHGIIVFAVLQFKEGKKQARIKRIVSKFLLLYIINTAYC